MTQFLARGVASWGKWRGEEGDVYSMVWGRNHYVIDVNLSRELIGRKGRNLGEERVTLGKMLTWSWGPFGSE